MHNEIRRQQSFKTAGWFVFIACLVLVFVSRYIPTIFPYDYGKSFTLMKKVDFSQFNIKPVTKIDMVDERAGLDQAETITAVEFFAPPKVEEAAEDGSEPKVVKARDEKDEIISKVLEKLAVYRQAEELPELLGVEWLKLLGIQTVQKLPNLFLTDESITDFTELEMVLANSSNLFENHIFYDVYWHQKASDGIEQVATDITDYWLSRHKSNGLNDEANSHATVAIFKNDDGYFALLVVIEPILVYNMSFPTSGQERVSFKLLKDLHFSQIQLRYSTYDCSRLIDVPNKINQPVQLTRINDSQYEFKLPERQSELFSGAFECDWRRFQFLINEKPINWGRVLFDKAANSKAQSKDGG